MSLNATVPVAVACVALAGCSWSSPRAKTGATLEADGAATTAVAAAPGPSSTPALHQPTPLTRLYGELRSRESAAASDGSANYAQVSFAADGACFDPDVDRSGKWMVFASTMHRATSDIYLKAVPGKTVTQLTNDPADDSMPAFSPDGRRVAFASNRAGNWDLYIMSVDGGQPMQLTSELEDELHPTWSPDGASIAFCKFGTQSQRWELWVVDAANPGVRRFLEYGLFPQWNPDPARSKILFQRARQRGSRYHGVWTIDYVNGDAMHPTEIVSASNAATINPAWSPDGSRVVFVTVVEPDGAVDAPPNQADVWMVNLDGSGRANLTNGQFANYQPVWAADGRVYFVSNRSGNDNVWAVATGRVIHATQGPAPTSELVGVTSPTAAVGHH